MAAVPLRPQLDSFAQCSQRTARTRMSVRTKVAAEVAASTKSILRAEPRWVVTVCAPSDIEGARELTEDTVRARGTKVEGWRKLGAHAYELVAAGGTANEGELRTALNAAGDATCADVVLQREREVRGGKRLAVFDLDSTLIAEETIDELALEAGVQGAVRDLTRRAMLGDVAFRDALSARVALLAGLPVAALSRVQSRATLTPGARELAAALRELGCATAVVSGGFRFLADHVRDTLGLDYAFANSLEVDKVNAALTGRTMGEVVDAEFKAKVLRELARRHRVPRDAVLAVGDGSNDLLMIQSAGLGVAFNAKPKLQNAAKARVNQPSLVSVLYLLGLDDSQIDSLASRF